MKKGTVAVLSTLVGSVAGMAGGAYFGWKGVEKKDEKVNKFKSYYNMLNQWLYLKQNDKSITKYFEDNNYKSIAIYGMGEMGSRLYDDLRNSDISVKYAIDKKAVGTYEDLVVYDLEDEFEDVDVIIVSAVSAFDEIEDELSDKVKCPIISLEDVVYEVC